MREPVGLLISAIAFATAISSSSSFAQYPGTTPSTAPSTSPSPGSSPTTTPSGSPSPGASSVTIQTKTTAIGEYLTDGQGKSLYLFAADTPNQVSTCTGACAQVWPPLIVPSGQTPNVGGDAQNSLLGTSTRADGTTQITYNGWPLYYYAPDQSPDDIKGHDLDSFGAKWYLVTPTGNRVGG